MSRGACVAAGAGAATLVMGVAVWAVLLRGGLSARPAPGALESRVARALRSFAMPAGARRTRSPIAPSPQAVAEGLAHFADHCAGCHGNDGSGQTELGRGLFPRAPDLRRPATQDLTDGELFHIIEDGVRLTGMPAFGGAPGSAEGSWHLVQFIRHLPRLSEAERVQMEALNPRSPAAWRAEQEEDSFLRGEAPAAGAAHGEAHH